ncbi:carbohydrate binding domain-containing protein [Amycolatopsis albispora]|uniref:carbohydrate binding domain-containing protein n=1 Tax=Amycolatopsis albispora TaxID=1804986 RepID=UPI001F02CA4F|nr:carbohydrate binding domain-containing protein [Amycolatopsis albispora]
MSRRSLRLGLSLAALTALTVVPVPVAAQAEPAYRLEIDPAAAGPDLPRSMYGVFFEDINHAADGGLYAELVRNRSFEFDRADHASFTGLTAWTPATTGGTATVADDEGRLNERNRRYLRLEVTGDSFAVTNTGYNAGIAVERGKRYDFSVWARGDAPLTASLTDADGTALARPVLVTSRAGEWAKFTGSFTARESSATGRLTVSAGASVSLDMVSLFPRTPTRTGPTACGPTSRRRSRR